MLGNTTSFTVDDVGTTDVVQQGRFSVVDVAHDGDNRWARLKVLFIVGVVKQLLQLDFFLLARFYKQNIGADLEREEFHLLVGKSHGRGDHLTVIQQETQDVGRGAVQLGTELLRRDAALDDNFAFGDRDVR